MNLSYRIVSVAIHKYVKEYSKFLQCIDHQEVVLKVSQSIQTRWQNKYE